MKKFVLSIGIIFLGLILGYVVQILLRKKIVSIPYDIETLRKTLQKIALLFFNPIAFMGAIWVVPLEDLKILALPIIGIIAWLLGGTLAFLFARLLGMSRKQTGSYIVSGGFSNIGSIGGLFCFIFLGEAGFALVSFYKLFEGLIYYSIGFPIAKSFSKDIKEIESASNHVKNVLTDPFILIATVSLLGGLILNMMDIERPEFYTDINAIFVPTATILLLSSIGMAMRFNRVEKYVKEGALIASIKFVIVPIITISIAHLLGFGEIDQGLPLKVVIILSSMPVAFTAMVPPTIYDLDVDLANATWLVTTTLLLLVVPLQLYMIALV